MGMSERRKTNECPTIFLAFGPEETLCTVAHGGETQAQHVGLIELRQGSRLGLSETAAVSRKSI